MPGAVGAAFVLAHHANASEYDLLVRPDRPLVRGRGIDRDPVMASRFEQVARDHPNRRGPDPSTLPGRADEEIDAGVLVVGRHLLAELDQAGDLAVDLDDEDRGVVVDIEELGLGLLERAVDPPPRDLGLGEERRKRGLIGSGCGAEPQIALAEFDHRRIVGPSDARGKCTAASNRRLDEDLPR